MKELSEVSSILVLAILILSTNAGCTLIGAAIGSANPEIENLTSDEEPLKVGTTVEVTLRDGSSATGSFVGFEEMDETSYASTYLSRVGAQTSLNSLPSLCEELSVRLRPDSSDLVVTFLGFSGFGRDVIKGRDQKSGLIWRAPIRNIIKTTNSTGKEVDGATYVALAENRLLPKSTQVSIETSDGIQQYPSDRIETISHRNHGSSALEGATFGLAADALLVFIALNYLNNMDFGFQ